MSDDRLSERDKAGLNPVAEGRSNPVSTAAQTRSPREHIVAALRDARPVERIGYLVGAALVLAGVAHVAVFLINGGPWYGPVSWRKPITFGLSFGLSLISVAWVASYLRLTERSRTVLLGVFAADCVLEVTGITLQAWRGVPSHLNTETAFDTVVAFGLALGGAVLVVVLGTLAVVALRGRVDGAPSMRLALRAGFGLLATGLLAGAAMIARGEILINGGDTQAGYDHAGFLKAFHGVTLHAVLVLPALAWLLARTRLDEVARTRVVAWAVTTYVAAAAAILVVSIVLV